MAEQTDAVDVISFADSVQFGAAVHIRHGNAVAGTDALVAALRPEGFSTIARHALSVAGIDDTYQFGLAVARIIILLEVHLVIHGGNGILAELVEVDVFGASIVCTVVFQRLGQGDRAYDGEVRRILAVARLIIVLPHTHGIVLLVVSHVLLGLAVEILVELGNGVVAGELVVTELRQDDQTLRTALVREIVRIGYLCTTNLLPALLHLLVEQRALLLLRCAELLFLHAAVLRLMGQLLRSRQQAMSINGGHIITAGLCHHQCPVTQGRPRLVLVAVQGNDKGRSVRLNHSHGFPQGGSSPCRHSTHRNDGYTQKQSFHIVLVFWFSFFTARQRLPPLPRQ